MIRIKDKNIHFDNIDYEFVTAWFFGSTSSPLFDGLIYDATYQSKLEYLIDYLELSENFLIDGPIIQYRESPAIRYDNNSIIWWSDIIDKSNFNLRPDYVNWLKENDILVKDC